MRASIVCMKQLEYALQMTPEVREKLENFYLHFRRKIPHKRKDGLWVFHRTLTS